MKNSRSLPVACVGLGISLLVLSIAAAGYSQTVAAPTTAVGWRQNWTGLFPEADPPLHWSRVPTNSVVTSLVCSAAKPRGDSTEGAAPMADGVVRRWLVLGPIPGGQEPGFDGAQVRPDEGDKAGDLAWKTLDVKTPNWSEHFAGSMDPIWVNLGAAVGAKGNNFSCYAHAWVHSAKGGKALIRVDHNFSMKTWVNGTEVYNGASQASAYLYWHHYSTFLMRFENPTSPGFMAELKPGWNSLLLRVSTAPNAPACAFDLRMFDAEPLQYQDKGFAWITPLPDRSNGNPVIVGSRIFLMAEPDELICINKKDGKVLWTRANGFYDALSDAEKAANAAFKEELDPLAAQIKAEGDYDKRTALRRKLALALAKIDAEKFGPPSEKMEGHPVGHFAVTGWTSPAPASDGKRVYVALENGVAACYELDGTRVWIKRADLDARDPNAKWWPQSYPASPVLIDGKFIITMGGLQALDPATGKLLWRAGAGGTASLIPMQAAGEPMVATSAGQVVRASDGKVMYSSGAGSGVCWNAPVFVDGVLYASITDAGGAACMDFQNVEGDPKGESIKPQRKNADVGAPQKYPKRGWVDLCMAASPLVWDGIYYHADYEGTLYAVDFKTGRGIWRQQPDGIAPMLHENAVGCASSPAIGGKYVFMLDNQGHCAIMEPGREYKLVAQNTIETYIPRNTTLPAREVTTYAAPIFEGKRIYIRGERNLYCIGEK